MAAMLAWDSLRTSCPHRVGREESAEAWGIKPLLEGPKQEEGERPHDKSTLRSRSSCEKADFSNTPYASWGPLFWPFLRGSARAPTIKTVRRTAAIKGIFDN